MEVVRDQGTGGGAHRRNLESAGETPSDLEVVGKSRSQNVVSFGEVYRRSHRQSLESVREAHHRNWRSLQCLVYHDLLRFRCPYRHRRQSSLFFCCRLAVSGRPISSRPRRTVCPDYCADGCNSYHVGQAVRGPLSLPSHPYRPTSPSDNRFGSNFYWFKLVFSGHGWSALFFNSAFSWCSSVWFSSDCVYSSFGGVTGSLFDFADVHCPSPPACSSRRPAWCWLQFSSVHASSPADNSSSARHFSWQCGVGVPFNASHLFPNSINHF